ncbi:GntR family transcriptional regulator [Streptomyces sp. rh34]|uniref:GntR family transcriptional regulator n=1 Tax=Streptomyces sp. rh34 TaxID=2034272 RepID=UPI0015CF7BA2|nr:GntR family transcriptional regulator [Streptomyces sp. rh34]
MRGYRDLAAELRRLIDEGHYQPGSTLPQISDLMEQYGLAKQTVRSALTELANEGYVLIRRKYGTLVRDRRSLRLPLSRYGAVLTPGGGKGPWETACAAQGLDGRMHLVSVTTEEAPDDIAEILGIAPGDSVVHRRRNALIGDEVIQSQHAWYPKSLADQAGLSGASKIEGGVFGAMTEAGFPPLSADEHVNAGTPKSDEAKELNIGIGVPVIRVQRITRTIEERVIEVLRVSAPSDRVELVYDRLPISQ